MRRALIAGTGLLCGLLYGSCRTVSVCEYDFERCGELEIIADRSKIELYQSSDNSLKISFLNRFSDATLECFLDPESHIFNPRQVGTLAPGDSGTFAEIKFSRALLQDLAVGRYTLLCQEVDTGRRPARLQNILLREPLRYSPPIMSSYAGTAEDRPIAEQIGFVGNTVVAVQSGLDAGQSPAKQVRHYNYDKSQWDNPAPAGYFANPFPIETLVAFSQSDVFLFYPLMMNLLLRRCAGVMPANPAGCLTIDASLQKPAAADKALVVTADGTQVVRADLSGNLTQASTRTTLKWSAVATTVKVSAVAKVKLASGDLNGDGTADLVAIWQDGSNQQMRVFVGQGGGFIEDAVWTQRLQEGLGVHTVTALAVGDVDADGCADVVVGRGLELAIVQNQQNRFAKVWSQTISPPRVIEISAVAVGRLTSDAPSQSLDIVAASNTPYDKPMPPAVPMSTLYLHAFRPQ